MTAFEHEYERTPFGHPQEDPPSALGLIAVIIICCGLLSYAIWN